jgi:hypothetical protein
MSATYSSSVTFSLYPGNTIEAVIGPVKVKVVCGDITKEKTDAIVSSTNSSLDLNSGKIPIPTFRSAEHI